MTDEDVKGWQTILEVGPSASLQDIKNSYLRLRRLYGGGSILLEPLEDEFPEKRRMKILVDLEEAYAKLLELHRNRSAETAASGSAEAAGEGESPEGREGFGLAEPAAIGEAVFSGPALRRVRERRGIDLVEISKQLKLRTELLRALEEERFEMLPEEIYLKTHLKNIAVCIQLPPVKVVEDYMARFKDWKQNR